MNLSQNRPQLAKILVPTDFSPASDAATDYALFLAAQADAEVDLLYVWDPRAEGKEGGRAILFAESSRGVKMESRLAQPRDDKIHFRGRVEFGDVCAAIVRVAADDHFDLIVMGLRARARLSHLGVGHLARRVAARTECPVITLGESPTRGVGRVFAGGAREGHTVESRAPV